MPDNIHPGNNLPARQPLAADPGPEQQPAVSPNRPATNRNALQAAFPHTVPVLSGYLFLGFAYGILMDSKGYGIGWTFLMSLTVYAGSAQYLAMTFLTTLFDPLNALVLTLVVNARHLFYGISMLEKYRGTGRSKLYLIFGLTDETFSINCATDAPAGVDRVRFYFWVTLLDHGYWISGSVLGAWFGSRVTFNTRGLDFVLTALFVVIFLSQWLSHRDHRPAIIGIVCSVLALLVFGPDHFIIPAMLAILAALTLGQGWLKNEVAP